MAPAGSTLLAAAPFSFGLPPVPLRMPVSALLGYMKSPYHRTLSWSDDTLYASHTVPRRMSWRPNELSLRHCNLLLKLPNGGHDRQPMLRDGYNNVRKYVCRGDTSIWGTGCWV